MFKNLKHKVKPYQSYLIHFNKHFYVVQNILVMMLLNAQTVVMSMLFIITAIVNYVLPVELKRSVSLPFRLIICVWM